MLATFDIKDPKKIEATISVTATVGEFMELIEQLKIIQGHSSFAWPLCDLSDAIGNVISDAKKHFYSHTLSKDDAP